MLIKKPVVDFRSTKVRILFFAAIAAVYSIGIKASHAESRFRLEKDSQGLIAPFKTRATPLADFVQEYSRMTHTPITTGGVWKEDLNGSVTLFLRRPLKPAELTEIFHRVVNDNGYSVVDAPAGNGWVVVRTRDARDLALPVYEIANVPESSRLVTAYHELKFADSEYVARAVRSFMPANSRIIPSTRSQLFITDTGSNIRKLNGIISKMDIEVSAKKQHELISANSSRPARSCGEQHIEKVVVENLEIHDGNFSQNPTQAGSIKSVLKGGSNK